jgi:hypothetical protein
MKQSADIWGKNAFHCACNKGHFDIVRYLKEQVEVDVTELTSLKMSALHFASYSGHKEIAEYLIDVCGLDPRDTDKEGQNALHFAASGGNLDLVKYFVEATSMNIFTSDKRNENVIDKAKASSEHISEYLEYKAFQHYKMKKKWDMRRNPIYLYTVLRELGEIPQATKPVPVFNKNDKLSKMKQYAARSKPKIIKNVVFQIHKLN